MASFDDWATDRRVNLKAALEIADDPGRTGHYLQGKYAVRATSGTTGVRGVFVMDKRNEAIGLAMALRTGNAWLGARDLIDLASRGLRMAFVVHGRGHGVASIAAIRLGQRPFAKGRFAMFSLQSPMAQLVAGLNRYQPATLFSYATEASLLAGEQEAGRLHISPSVVILTGEALPEGHDRIQAAFGAKVINIYASNECDFLTYSCPAGSQHVNSDWVILEPVDEEYRPAEPGEESHTLLISNLANRVQPILRYDLGDRAELLEGSCPCGSSLPMIRFHGRVAEVLYVPDARGSLSALPPGVFGELGHIPGIETFQVVQTGPATLSFRDCIRDGADADEIWRVADREARRILGDRNLPNVAFLRTTESPQWTTGGKLPRIIPLRETAA